MDYALAALKRAGIDAPLRLPSLSISQVSAALQSSAPYEWWTAVLSEPPLPALDTPWKIVCALCITVTVLRELFLRFWLTPPVLLIDFATYKPPAENLVSQSDFKRMQRSMGVYSKDAIEFMDKMIERTGLGDATGAPSGALRNPPQLNIQTAREESATVIFGCVSDVLRSTGTDPRSIDILIVNCSLFNPTPSLTAMIINKFKLKESVQSYNLSGMGCSAGIISIHLAKQLLRVHRNSTALVVSTENLTQAWYQGNEREMLIPNALFRLGGAAILLSSKRSDQSRAKHELLHTVRTHLGADDEAYSCVFQDMDSAGVVGVRLNKNIAAVANRALRYNLMSLGPLILPYSQQLKFVLQTSWLRLRAAVRGTKPRMEMTKAAALSAVDEKRTRGPVTHTPRGTRIGVTTAAATTPRGTVVGVTLSARNDRSERTGASATSANTPSPAPVINGAVSRPGGGGSGASAVVPDFTSCIQHFCIHAGGKGVLDALQTGLNLTDERMKPSRVVLERYGNTSSSSVWYEMEEIQNSGKLKAGDVTWQLGFGSGFKCNSAIWKKL